MINSSIRSTDRLAVGLITLSLLATPLVMADEGMWTLDDLPLELLGSRYGFRPRLATFVCSAETPSFPCGSFASNTASCGESSHGSA